MASELKSTCKWCFACISSIDGKIWVHHIDGIITCRGSNKEATPTEIWKK